MALTRKMLKELGIEDEAIEKIITAHSETVTALKNERDDAQDELEAERTGGQWKKKYDDEHAAFEKYKGEVESKEAYAVKEAAYRQLLVDAGVDSKRINTIIRAEKSTIDELKLGKDGKLTDADSVKSTIKKDWADFIVSAEEKGVDTPAPPANSGGKAMSKAEIFRIKDPIARQNAIAENLNLFNKE